MNQRIKWCSAVLAAGLLLGGTGWGAGMQAEAAGAVKPAAAGKYTKTEVVLDWNGKELSQKGLYSGGSTYVPATVLRDVMGMPIQYDAKTKTYTIGKGYNKLKAMAGEGGDIFLTVNGLQVGEMNARIMNGRLYLPYKVLNEYMGIQGIWSPSLKGLSMKAKKENAISIGSKTLKTSDKKADITIRYPVISGLENAEVQSRINEIFKKHAEEFKQASLKELKEAPAPRAGVKYEYTGDFVVHLNAKGLLSITSYEYTYSGGAHGMTYRTSRTFSLKDGSELKLGDVINLGGKNKQKLNQMVLAKMKKDGGYLGGFKGVPASAEFYLKDNEAVLYFQLYEYTAYAFGFPEFALPLKDWK